MCHVRPFDLAQRATYPQIKPFNVTDDLDVVTDDLGQIDKSKAICHVFWLLLKTIIDAMPHLWITCRIKIGKMADQGRSRDTSPRFVTDDLGFGLSRVTDGLENPDR
jgi:hypothetical protein